MKDRFGYGVEEYQEGGKVPKWKRLLRGEQVAFSDRLNKKIFSEDERTYWDIEEKIGKENLQKLVYMFSQTEAKKNPKLNLNDFNQYALQWIDKVEREAK